METIKRVLIENFQSHARTEVDFSDGLNVIVGPSDHGKSAIIRALRWALFNEPRGADFIRTGENECRVTIELGSGTVITRQRSSSKNRYILNTPEGKEEVFEGFGSTVPKEIIDAHGMSQVHLDSDMVEPLNFGYQLDGPFLLSGSGATKAKAIGRLSGVHIIDAAIRVLLRDITGLQQEERRLAAAETNLQERLPEYDDLPELAAAVEQGKHLAGLLQEKIDRCRQISALAVKWAAVKEEYEGTARTLRILASIFEAEKAAAKALAAFELYGKLKNASRKLIGCYEEEQEMRTVLAKTEKLNEAETKFLRLQSKQVLFDRLKRASDALRTNESGGAIAKKTLARTDDLVRIEFDCYRRGNRLLTDVKRLSELRKRLSLTQGELVGQRTACQALSRLGEAENCWKVAERAATRRQRVSELLSAWRENDKNRATGKEYRQKLLKRTDNILHSYQTKLREIGKCPFCFNPIDEPAVRRIVEIMAKEGKPVNAE